MEKKATLLSLICCLFSFTGFSQLQIPNGDFENIMNGAPLNWQKSGFGFTDASFSATTDSKSGEHALSIENADASGLEVKQIISFDVSPDNLPEKLTGFVKYNIASFQRARIEVNLLSQVSSTQRNIVRIGQQSFSGSSNNEYVPVNIEFAYGLIDGNIETEGEKMSISGIEIKIISYGELYRKDDFFSADENENIKSGTFISVDDLSFQGSTPNVYQPASIRLPMEFETWYPMDGGYLPNEGIITTAETYQNNTKYSLSRSDFSSQGNYSAKITLDSLDQSYSIWSGFKKSSENTVFFDIAGELNPDDNIVIYVIKGFFDDIDSLVISSQEIGTGFKTFELDISRFSEGDDFLLTIDFNKRGASPLIAYLDHVSYGTLNGVFDSSTRISYDISPNPSKGLFRLSGSSKVVSVYNLIGEEISFESDSDQAQETIDIRNAEDGVFILITEDGTTYKVLKE